MQCPVISSLSCPDQSELFGSTKREMKRNAVSMENIAKVRNATILLLFALFFLDVTWPSTRCASSKARRHARVIWVFCLQTCVDTYHVQTHCCYFKSFFFTLSSPFCIPNHQFTSVTRWLGKVISFLKRWRHLNLFPLRIYSDNEHFLVRLQLGILVSKSLPKKHSNTFYWEFR
jgi:hypothetical protein